MFPVFMKKEQADIFEEQVRILREQSNFPQQLLRFLTCISTILKNEHLLLDNCVL